MTSPFSVKKRDDEESSDNGKKYTSQGISFNEMESNKQEQTNMIADMKKHIIDLLADAHISGKLLTTNFYFVSTTWFCQTLQNDIYPAELALAKFSLQSGVFDTLHMYINPGKLPLGESSTAKDHANETHKLPIPPNSKGYKDFVEILRQIINFLSDEESIPILYCHTDEIMDTKKTIDKIATQGGELSLEIRVFPLEDLLYPLKDLTAKIANESSREKDMPFLNVVVTRDIIERDRYKYTSGIGCTYHDEQDCPNHCTLSKVKRWGFTISDQCVKHLDINIIAGQHLPKQCVVAERKEPTVEKTGEVPSRYSRSIASGSDVHVSSVTASEVSNSSMRRGMMTAGRGNRPVRSLELLVEPEPPRSTLPFGRGRKYC